MQDAREQAAAAAGGAVAAAAGTDAGRAAVAPFLAQETDFLQQLAALVQSHAESVKAMAKASRAKPAAAPAPASAAPAARRRRRERGAGAALVEGADLRRDAAHAAVRPHGHEPPAETAGSSQPEAAPPIRVEEPATASVSAGDPDDDAGSGDGGDRTLRELFWGEE